MIAVDFYIETDRLLLRPWRDADRPIAHAMAADPEVMRFLPGATRAAADALIDRQIAMQAEYGHCFWAVERPADACVIGFCGVAPPRPPLAEYEIGWRLARDAWGQGYATEGARAALAWTWAKLTAATVVAITVPANHASRQVMERIGMIRQPQENFDHPALDADDPLRPHVLYRVCRPT